MPDPPPRRRGGSNLYSRPVIPWAGQWPDLSPVTIVRLDDRWVAFLLPAADLPPAHAEPGFLSTYGGPHGVGESPDGAYLDLARRLPPDARPDHGR